MQNNTLLRNWSPKRPGYWNLYHQSHEHDALEVFKAICCQVEDMAPLLIGKKVDHSSIGWVMKRISPQYLNELVYDIYLYMDSILKGGLYITDSTGFTCDRYEVKDAAMKEIRMKQTVKLHISVEYYPHPHDQRA